MPILLLYLGLGLAGFFVVDQVLDNVRENLFLIVVIGGVTYYIYKKSR